MDDSNRKSEEIIEEIEGLVSCIEGGRPEQAEDRHNEIGFGSSEERLKILFESAPDGIYLNDLTGVVVDGNRAAEELIGYAREELIGKNFAEMGLLSEEQIPEAAENLRKNAQGQPAGPDEFTLKRKDGSSIAVEIRTFPVKIAGQALSMGIARDITRRKQAEEALQYRVEFERLISTLSTRFIKPGETTRKIQETLEAIGKFADVDRAYVFQLRDDGETVDNTHEWCGEGVEAQIDNLKAVSIAAELPWFWKKMKANEVFHVPAVADLPAEGRLEKEHFETQDIRALVVVPMVSEGQLSGFLGFDSVRSEKTWPDDIIALLQITGENISRALARKRAEKELKASKRFSEDIVETASALIVVLDDEGAVTTFNRFAEELTGFAKHDVLGKNWFDLFIPEDQKTATGQVHREVLDGKPDAAIHENVILAKDGEKRLIRWNNRSVRDEAGQVAGVIAIGIDVTEYRQAVEKERAATERLRLSIDSMLEGYALHEAIFGEDGRMVDFKYLGFNPSAQRIVGVTREQIIGKTALEMFPAIVERGLMDKYADVMATGRPARIEDFYYEGDNLNKAFDISCFRVDERHFVCVFRDFTERKRAEEALRESERRFRTLSEAAFEGIAFGEKGILVDVNRAFAEIYHCTLDELRGKEVMDLVAPDDRDMVKENMLSGYEGVYEHRGIRKDGSIIDLEARGRGVKRDGRKVRLTAIRDVTERKRAERELEERLRFETLVAKLSAKFVNLPPEEVDKEIEESLRHIVEFLRVDRSGILEFSEDQSELCITHTYAIAGARPVPAVHVTDRFPWIKEQLSRGETICISRPDELPEQADTERQFLLDEGQKAALMTPLKVGGSILGALTVGSLRCERSWSEQTVSRVRLVGEILANALMRRRAENALRQSEEHYRAIIEDQTELICRYLPDFTITFANEAYCRYFGKTREELIGRKFMPLVPEEDRLKIKEHFASLGPDNLVATHEHRVIDRDGQIRWQQWTNRTILDDAGDIIEFQGTGRDITERKKAEEKAREHQSELAHVWRVNTMGEMASGLAHELNQPLCAILNYANACLRMMKKDGDSSGKLFDPIEQIASQADRAGQIIRRIRGLVAKRKPQTSPADINDIVAEVLEMEKAEASHKNVTVRTELAENLPPVFVDRIEIEEVVLNLVRNAFDAMSEPSVERREVTITTGMTQDDLMEVCVRDTGKGFAALGNQIFNPFFTTKINGLGIGLSISGSIVESHGGRLWAEQNPDCGATFRFTLPVYTAHD